MLTIAPGAGLVTSAGLELDTTALRAAVARARRDLPADLGGRVVTVAVSEPAALLVTVLAVLEAGGVAAPLDLRAPADALVTRARPLIAVTGAGNDGALACAPRADPRRLPTEAALLIFTSGSTGAPKGVVLGRRALGWMIEAICGYLPVAAHRRTAIVLPLVYSYALVGQALVGLRAGATLLLLSDVPYPAVQLELMVRHDARGLSSVPASLRLLARAAEDAPARPDLGYVASAGGRLDDATRHALRATFPGARLFDQYGLTEAAPRVTALSDEEPAFWRGSVGRPLPGITVQTDERGALWVDTPARMLGYLDDDDGTAAVLGPRGLRTGDLGHVDEGGYVFVTGREDGVVKVAGERVSLDEVAAVLRAAPGVTEACVVAIPDALLGSRLVAYVEGDAAAARREAQARLAPARRPARITAVAALPRLPSGKLAVAEVAAWARRP